MNHRHSRRNVTFLPPARAPRPAAGLLCYHTDRHGQTWWLLGHRIPAHGGTWANLGGSLNRGEDPLVGAVREFHEEIGIPAADLTGARVAAVINDCGSDDKPYTMYVIDLPVWFDEVYLSYEHSEVAWFPTADVTDLDLHPKFAAAWQRLTEGARA